MIALPSAAWVIGLGAAFAAALVLLVKFQGPFLRWLYDNQIAQLEADIRKAVNRGDLDSALQLRERLSLARLERRRWS
jgi:soluble lytic murein transglycosylase-like protein